MLAAATASACKRKRRYPLSTATARAFKHQRPYWLARPRLSSSGPQRVCCGDERHHRESREGNE